MNDVEPSAVCRICGHSRGNHETIERQWCAQCASVGSRQDKAWHLFEAVA